MKSLRVGSHLAQGLEAVIWSDGARLEDMENNNLDTEQDEFFRRIWLSSGEKSATG